MLITEKRLRKFIKKLLVLETSDLTPGVLYVTRGSHGHIEFSDNNNNEWSMGHAVAELLDADIADIFKVGKDQQRSLRNLISSRRTEGLEGLAGPMEWWDPDVFSASYNVDPNKVARRLAEKHNLRVEETEFQSDDYSDDSWY